MRPYHFMSAEAALYPMNPASTSVMASTHPAGLQQAVRSGETSFASPWIEGEQHGRAAAA